MERCAVHAVDPAGLATAVEQAADGIAITDTDGVIQYVNPAFTAMTGYSSEEAVGQNASILRSGVHPPEFYKELWQTIRSGNVWQGEITHRRKDGTLYDEEMRIAPIRDSHGAITGFINNKHNVTKRRAHESAQALLAAIVESSEDAIVTISPTGTILTWNRGAEKLLGYSAEQSIGQDPSLFCPPDKLSRLQECIAYVLQGNSLANYEGVCRHADGRKIYIIITGSPIRNASGKVVAAAAIVQDITERKRSEQALRESEARLREVFEYAPVAMYVAGPDSHLLRVNAALCQLLGYSEEELLAKSWLELYSASDMESGHKLKELMWSGQVNHVDLERDYFHRDGHSICCHVRISMLHTDTDNGTPQQAIVHITDITERKRAEAALAESEERFHNMADSCPSMLWITNAEGNIQFLNRACRKFRNSARQHISANEWQKSIHPDDFPLYVAALEQSISEHSQFRLDYRVQRADGEWRIIGSNADPRFSADGEYLGHIGLSADITDRKRAEAELVHAREAAEEANLKLAAQHEILDHERNILRTFIDNVPDLMFVKDTEGRFLVANVATAKWNGENSPEDLIGKSDYDCFPKELADVFYESEQRLMRERMPLLDVERSTHDKDTGEVRYALSSKVPLFDNKGNVIGLAGIARDITERKKYEDSLRDSNSQLQAANVRANELAVAADAANQAKSRFLANMSHEIRTPMNGVIGMAQLLLQTDLTAEQRRYAEVAQTSGQTLLTLIDQILDLSKIEAGKVTLEERPFNLAQTIDDVVQLLRNQANAKSIDIVPYVSPHIPPLLSGDAHRLRQVLINLVSNAIKFTSQGSVTVHTELFKRNNRVSTVRFTVTDTGIGLRQDQIDLLFSPFVQADASTTRRFGGSGLGLAISKQLVEMMGGCIGVDSIEGQGSTFWFTAVFQHVASDAPSTTAPRSQPALANRIVGPTSLLRSGHGQRILVAEDNPTNREVVLAQLKKLGYRAEAFPDGAQAVDAIQRGGFDLVLMDCSMPIMDGYQATRQIRRSDHTDLPIIALTASAMPSDRQLCIHAGMNDYLAKPVELVQLADVLARWLPSSPVAVKAQQQPAGTSDAGVFDAAALMQRLMDDRELASTILRGFLQDAPSGLQRLHERIERSDAPGVHAQAHSLKKAAATVAAEALRVVALDIEQAANAVNLGHCRQLLPHIVDQFNRFKIAVERDGWIQDLSTQVQDLRMAG